MKLTLLFIGTAFVFLVVMTAANAQVPAWSTNGLVAYYPFNGDTTDASGNGNDGTATNSGPTADRTGQADSAWNFLADVTSGITVTDAPSLNFTDQMTLSVLVRFDQPWNFHAETLIWKCPQSTWPASAGWFLGVDQNDVSYGDGMYAVQFQLNTGSGEVTCQKILSYDALTNWTHIVCVYSNGIVSLYLNGSLEAANAASGPVSSSPSDLEIGFSEYPTSGEYVRDMDDSPGNFCYSSK
jgi:hypothetical protein